MCRDDQFGRLQKKAGRLKEEPTKTIQLQGAVGRFLKGKQKQKEAV
jgi:hypothetical protein